MEKILKLIKLIIFQRFSFKHLWEDKIEHKDRQEEAKAISKTSKDSIDPKIEGLIGIIITHSSLEEIKITRALEILKAKEMMIEETIVITKIETEIMISIVINVIVLNRFPELLKGPNMKKKNLSIENKELQLNSLK